MVAPDRSAGSRKGVAGAVRACIVPGMTSQTAPQDPSPFDPPVRRCGALIDDGVDEFGIQVMGATYCDDDPDDCGCAASGP
jgi:hypothetical protein